MYCIDWLSSLCQIAEMRQLYINCKNEAVIKNNHKTSKSIYICLSLSSLYSMYGIDDVFFLKPILNDMKKEMFHVWLIFFLAFWGFFVGIFFLSYKINGGEFRLLEKSIIAFLFSIGALSGQIITVWITLIPRSKYLESNDITRPKLKFGCSSVAKMPQGFDFNSLKAEIADKWVITFSDEKEKVLKCRTKFNYFRNWGSAAWMKYDADAKILYLHCFPLMSYFLDNFTQKMQKEIETYSELTLLKH